MIKKILALFILLIFLSQISFGQKKAGKTLTKQQVIDDLGFLSSKLQELSSYQGLNGFSYQTTFDNYLKTLDSESIPKSDLGIFLTKTIGQIGDRHSSVKKFKLPKGRYLPFSVAPYQDKVVAIDYDKSTKTFDLLYPKYPYLASINGIPIKEFLLAIYPEDIKAPKDSYHNRATEKLRKIEECYAYLEKELPEQAQIKLSGENGDTTLVMEWTSKDTNKKKWSEHLKKKAYRKEGELNDLKIAKKHFKIDENNIAYVHIPRMAHTDEAPIYFEELNNFMSDAETSKSLIIDVRSNSGGGRELIFELAKYLIAPEAIHVVNIAQQRIIIGENEKNKNALSGRYLYPLEHFDENEKEAIASFLKTFQPMYDLPIDKFTAPHFTLFNGKKLTKDGYYYNKPVYILMDERSFSAASILCAFFKNIPNIKLVGVNTDGSSGNSRSFKLPESKLKVKVSTMVSFQKDGKILDGFGTAPDIKIERSLEQVLWKEDYQLNHLKKIINGK